MASEFPAYVVIDVPYRGKDAKKESSGQAETIAVLCPVLSPFCVHTAICKESLLAWPEYKLSPKAWVLLASMEAAVHAGSSNHDKLTKRN